MDFNPMLMNAISLLMLVTLICCTGIVTLIFFDMVKAKQDRLKQQLPPVPLQTQYIASGPLPQQYRSSEATGINGEPSATGVTERGTPTGMRSLTLKLGGALKGISSVGLPKGRTTDPIPAPIPLDAPGEPAYAGEAAPAAAPEHSSLNRAKNTDVSPGTPRPSGMERGMGLPAIVPDPATRTEDRFQQPSAGQGNADGIGVRRDAPLPNAPGSEGIAESKPGTKAVDAGPTGEAGTAIKIRSLTDLEMRSMAKGKTSSNIGAKEKHAEGSEDGTPRTDNVLDLLGMTSTTPSNDLQTTPAKGTGAEPENSPVFVDIPEHLTAKAESNSESVPVTVIVGSATDILRKVDPDVVARELPKYVGELRTSLITLKNTLQKLEHDEGAKKTAPP